MDKEIKNKFEHFILTHFNVKFKWSKGKASTHGKVPDHKWFKHRLELFNKICYPSVIHQTIQDFKWLIFFDDETTDKRLLKKYKKCIKIFMKNYNFWTYKHIVEQLKQRINPDTEWLMTTRFDCDDALEENYIKIMHDNFIPRDLILNPTKGISYDIRTNQACQWNYICPNPYMTTIENIADGNIKTCFIGSHPRMRKYFKKFKQVRTEGPLWLQTIHDRNLGNFLRGKPIKISKGTFKKFHINLKGKNDDS